MNSWDLIRRSLWFYRRTHLGVVLGTALASAVLIGALAVGDSLRGSLRAMALARLGGVQAALTTPEEFFPDDDASALADSLHCDAAAVLSLSGRAENDERPPRASQVTVLGVDERFWALCPCGPLLKGDEDEQVVLNEALARRLGVRAGDRVSIRLPKPSMLPADVAISSGARPSVRLSATVKAVASDAQFGRFSLRAGPAPLTAFVPLRWLQQKADLAGRANTLLAGRAGDGTAGELSARANQALRQPPLQRQMLGVEVGPAAGGVGEVRSSRIFIPPPIEEALARTPGAIGVFTYFANSLEDRNQTPYSMVTGVGPLRQEPNRPWASLPHMGLPSVKGLQDDQIVLTDWLTEDLFASPGEDLDLVYFVLGTGGRLAEQTSRFRVAAAPPVPVASLDPKLMPDFPGLAEANESRDWRPGIPIVWKRLRKKDEQYWRDYRGTPKALVTLAAAQKMWGNRFGRLTAVRFRLGSTDNGIADAAATVGPYLAKVDPAALGLVFRPVREEALAAAEKSMDFGWLFAGMSMFLIVSALLLTGLLFGLSIRQRAQQVGTLLAVGFTPGHVRRLLLGEGAGLAVAGVVLGAAAAVGYGAAVLSALRAILPAATDAASLRFHVSAATLGEGAAMSLLMAVGAMWLALRRQTRARAAELLSSGGEAGGIAVSSARGLRWARAATVALPALALAAVLFAAKGAGAQAAGVFFGAGALLLGGGVAAAYAALGRRLAGGGNPAASLAALGSSNSARRMGRSIAVVAMLACGTFVVIAVGANWKGPSANPYDRASGTGGFALLAQTAVPIQADPFTLHDPSVNGPAPSTGGVAVPIRVHQGDEASCLNLNRPQQPAIWGVDPAEPALRMSFSFAEKMALPAGSSGGPAFPDYDYSWGRLAWRLSDGAVPAVADATTLEWALGAGVGDVVMVQDEQGRPVQLRIVASLAGSILQGGLLISDSQFLRLYPSSGGYRMFLIDSPPALTAQVEKGLSANRFLQDAGLDIVRTSERLAQLDAVENAYLSMFQVLGGLGVLLGTVGLGLVVFRNVMERRGELGLMRAVGFSTRQLRRLVLWEHWFLLAMGLAVGVAAGLAAALPGLRGAGGEAGSRFPWAPLACTVLAIAASGLAWTWLAASLATRGRLIAALRNE